MYETLVHLGAVSGRNTLPLSAIGICRSLVLRGSQAPHRFERRSLACPGFQPIPRNHWFRETVQLPSIAGRRLHGD